MVLAHGWKFAKRKVCRDTAPSAPSPGKHRLESSFDRFRPRRQSTMPCIFHRVVRRDRRQFQTSDMNRCYLFHVSGTYHSASGTAPHERGPEVEQRIRELSALFMAQRHALLGFIYGMVRDSAAAEDILQEVWLRLADASERNEVIVHPARWCRGVAKNLILHYWRDRQSAKVLVDSELLELIEQSMQENEDHWAARRQALMECVDDLPRHSKRLLTLKYDQGLTFDDMAKLLDRTNDSLKMALSRLRAALLECAERKLRPAEPHS